MSKVRLSLVKLVMDMFSVSRKIHIELYHRLKTQQMYTTQRKSELFHVFLMCKEEDIFR